MEKRGGLQTGFNDAIPTPDVGGTGLNGLGNSFDQGDGGNGLTATPWKDKPVPNQSGTPTGGGEIPAGPAFIDVPGGGPQGPGDITTSRNTIDKK